MGYFDKFGGGEGTIFSQEPIGSQYDQESEEDYWEFRPGDRLEASFQNIFSDIWGAAAAGAKAVGADSASQWAIKRSEDLAYLAAEKGLEHQKFTEISNPLDAGQWVLQTLVDQVPVLATTFLGGAGVGTVAARTAAASPLARKSVETMFHKMYSNNLKAVQKFNPSLAATDAYKAAALTTAKEVGRLTGMAGTEGMMGAGQAFLSDVDTRGYEEASPLAAAGVGTGWALIGALNPMNRALASGNLAGKGGRPFNIFSTALSEAGEEVGQEVVTMAHEAGIDVNKTLGEILSSPEGRGRLIESGAAGALIGGMFGSMRRREKAKEEEAQATSEATSEVINNPEDLLEAEGIPTARSENAQDIKIDNTIQMQTSLGDAFSSLRSSREQKVKMTAQERIDALLKQIKDESSRLGSGIDLNAPPTVDRAGTSTQLPLSPSVQSRPLPITPDPIVSARASQELEQRARREAEKLEQQKILEGEAQKEQLISDEVDAGRIQDEELAQAWIEARAFNFDLAQRRAISGGMRQVLEDTNTLNQTENLEERQAIREKIEKTSKQVKAELAYAKRTGVLPRDIPGGATIIEEGQKGASTAQKTKRVGKDGKTKETVKEAPLKPYTEAMGIQTETKAPETQVDTTTTPAVETIEEADVTFAANPEDVLAKKRGDKSTRPLTKREQEVVEENKEILANLKPAPIPLNQRQLLKGFRKDTLPVKGKKVPLSMYTNTENGDTIIKSSDKKYILASNVEGQKSSKGTFTSLKDAVEASQTGVDSDTFYNKTEESKATHSVESVEQVSKEDMKLFGGLINKMYKTHKTQKPDSTLTEAEYFEKFVEQVKRAVKARAKVQGTDQYDTIIENGIYRAARTFKIGKGTTFKTHIVNTSSGAVLDYIKKNREVSGFSTAAEEGQTSTIDSASEEDVKDGVVTVETKAKKEKEEAPPVKKISVEDYKKEKEAKGEEIKPPENLSKKMSKKEYVTGRPSGVEIIAKEEGKPQVAEDPTLDQEAEATVEVDEDTEGDTEGDTEVDTEVEVEVEEAPKKTIIRRKAKRGDIQEDDLATASAQGRANTRAFLNSITNAEEGLTVLDGTQGFEREKGMIKLLRDTVGDQLSNIPIKDVSEVPPELRGMNLGPVFTYKGIIYFNKRWVSTSKKDAIARHLIHETWHVLSLDKLKTDPELAERFDGILKDLREQLLTQEEIAEIERLYQWKPHKWNEGFPSRPNVLKRLPSNHYYALMNASELLSVTFEDSTFQDTLDILKVKEKSFFERVIDTILSLFGLDTTQGTYLREIMSEGVKIARGDQALDTEVLDAEIQYLEASQTRGAKSTKSRAEQIKIMLENDLRGKPIDILKDWSKKALGSFKDIAQSSTERLRSIAPQLIGYLRRMEFEITNKNMEYHEKVRPFIDKYRKLKKEDQVLLDLLLMNSDPVDVKDRNELLQKLGMTKEFENVRDVLADIYKRKGTVGLNKYSDNPYYFPRRVKDVRALLKTIKGSPDKFNIIQAELDALGEEATEADKEAAILSMINTGRFPALALLNPTSSKKRTIQRVSSEWKHHYSNSADALISHIYESNEAVESRVMFGDTQRKKRLDRATELRKQLETSKLTKDQREKKVAELVILEEALDNAQKEFTDGVSQFLVKNAPNLTDEQADEVVRTIRARLSQKGMYGTASTLRNLMLITTLSSPTSAITQIGDLAFSIHKYGLFNTLGAITGKSIITPKDLDLSHSLKEFQTEGSSLWVDRVLTWSGLSWMDRFGKTTTMNSAFNKASKMKLKDFLYAYGDTLGESAEATHKDLVEKKNSKLTRFFVFNELSNWQPISMSEMPLKYLEMRNGRIFYTLKSFNIKALNSIYRESVHGYRVAKTPQERAKALKETGKLIILLVLAGASADELKDFLLGRGGSTFSDHIHTNFLKLGLASRYTIDRGASQGLLKTFLKDVLIPPTGIIDDPLTDIYNFVAKDEVNMKTLNLLPWGKLPYNWYSPKAESSDFKNLKESIKRRVVSGESISSVRKDMYKYNRWAKEQKESLVTYKSLMKAKREANKKS